MRILVTGGAGYIGCTLVANLLQNGYQVRVLDALMFGGEGLLGVYHCPSFELKVGDVRSPIHVERALSNVDAVVHLAALVGDPPCKVNPSLTETINYEGTCRVYEAARRAGIRRFVFVSTCSNYGIQEQPADENSPLHPVSLYAETKIHAEEYILGHTDSQMTTTVVRLATAFGLAPRMRFNLLVSQLSREAFLTHRVSVYGSDAWRPYIHVTDIARALGILIEASAELIHGEVFNIGTENVQKADLVNMIRKWIPDLIVEHIGQVTDPRNYRVSFEKFNRRFNFVPAKSVDMGVAEVFCSLDKGVFANPLDPKFDIWLDEAKLMRVDEPAERLRWLA